MAGNKELFADYRGIGAPNRKSARPQGVSCVFLDASQMLRCIFTSDRRFYGRAIPTKMSERLTISIKPNKARIPPIIRNIVTPHKKSVRKKAFLWMINNANKMP